MRADSARSAALARCVLVSCSADRFAISRFVVDSNVDAEPDLTVLEEAFASGEEPGKIVADKGYAQINDSSVVENIQPT